MRVYEVLMHTPVETNIVIYSDNDVSITYTDTFEFIYSRRFTDFYRKKVKKIRARNINVLEIHV